MSDRLSVKIVRFLVSELADVLGVEELEIFELWIQMRLLHAQTAGIRKFLTAPQCQILEAVQAGQAVALN
jgi:hypothetical protein